MNKPGLTTVFVVIGGLALGAAVLVGVSDNPPGIALLYGGIVCLILAVVHRWRRPKSFLLLFVGSAVGFLAFAILHNVFYGIGVSTTIPWLRSVMEALHVGAFLIALLLCPAGVMVGAVGWLATIVRTRKEAGDPAAERPRI